MISFLYQLYHRIPASTRINIIKLFEKRAEQGRLFSILWNKLILRYHFLYGARQGITLELTDKCNLKCIYCPKSLDIGIKGGNMSWELFIKAVDGALSENNIEIFNLVGFGEPFLYPDLENAIRYIKQKRPKADIRITSNGTLLNAKIGIDLVNAGLTQITISVNATSADQYQRINISNDYEKIVENTKEFLKAVNMSGKRILVVIQVLSVINDEHQIQNFREFWKPHLQQCGVIQVQPFVNWAGQIDTQDILDREKVARENNLTESRKTRNVPVSVMFRELKSRKKENLSPFAQDSSRKESEIKPYPCFHLQRTRIISREGNALACCMVYPDEQGDLELGNIRDHSFSELYLSGKVVKLRKDDLQGQLGVYSPCNTCDAWKTVPNIWWKNPLHRWIGSKWL